MLTIHFKMVKGCGEEKKIPKLEDNMIQKIVFLKKNSEIQQRSGKELPIQIQALDGNLWNSVVESNQDDLISSSMNKRMIKKHRQNINSYLTTTSCSCDPFIFWEIFFFYLRRYKLYLYGHIS